MARFLKRSLRTLCRWVVVAVSTIVLFDVGCFFVLPAHFSGLIFLGYRVGLLPDGGLGRGYPHYYYEAHPERGFDIGTFKSPRDHYVFNYPKNYSYPIWSNSLGCFDNEHTDLRHYVYLAGDSTTWGYTRFDKKFGTLLEQRLHLPVVKCGVSHTGQLHQLSKMKEVISKIGQPPAVILIVWSPNDIINDAFHPHSTVIDGWQVDTTYVTPTDGVVRDAPEVLAERVRGKMSEHSSPWRKPKWFLIKYSAVYNIFIRALYGTSLGRWFTDAVCDPPGAMDIYSLQRNATKPPILKYLNDELARKNQDALLQVQKYADTIHSKLVVALLSVQPNHNAEVHDFLRDHSIEYIDVGDAGYNFNDKHLSWRIDPHANEEGNEVIANALYRFVQPALRAGVGKSEDPTN